MPTAPHSTRWILRVVTGLAAASLLAAPLVAASDSLPAAQQNALVQKYCAVCHTDRSKNGGLSLEHYDAAQLNPPLAAMLLTKLRNGAMSAAGIGKPDQATTDAWIAATVRQAEHAEEWSAAVTEASEGLIHSVSIVREVPPRKAGELTPFYRLTLNCNAATGAGEIRLAWSPQPQTEGTFFVSLDGKEKIPHHIKGGERMGNDDASAPIPSSASAVLNTSLPAQSLTISDVFPHENVIFPIGSMAPADRQHLSACFHNSSK